MKDKILTLALTIYNPKISELNNYFYSFSKINFLMGEKSDLVQFMILSDNPELEVEIQEYLNVKLDEYEFIEYIPCEENGQRIKQILDNIENVKGKFIKLLDPDDFLLPEETVSLIENVLLNSNDESLLINSYNRTTDEITIENYRDIETNIFYKRKSFNPNTTYPVKILKKINWDFKMLIWSDDLLGFLSILNGAEIEEIPDEHFYLNRGHSGVSITKTFHSSMRYINDSIKFLEVAYNSSKSNEDLIAFREITSKPSKWFFEQIFNDLIFNEILSKEEKISLMKKVFILSRPFWIEPDEFNEVENEILNKI